MFWSSPSASFSTTWAARNRMDQIGWCRAYTSGDTGERRKQSKRASVQWKNEKNLVPSTKIENMVQIPEFWHAWQHWDANGKSGESLSEQMLGDPPLHATVLSRTCDCRQSARREMGIPVFLPHLHEVASSLSGCDIPRFIGRARKDLLPRIPLWPRKRTSTNQILDSYWLHGFTNTEELGDAELSYVYSYVIRVRIHVIVEGALAARSKVKKLRIDYASYSLYEIITLGIVNSSLMAKDCEKMFVALTRRLSWFGVGQSRGCALKGRNLQSATGARLQPGNRRHRSFGSPARFVDVEYGAAGGRRFAKLLRCTTLPERRGLAPIDRPLKVGRESPRGNVVLTYTRRTLCSPPTRANQVQSPARADLGFSHVGIVPGGFSRGSPISPSLSFRRNSMLTAITLIGSQDLALHSLNLKPNFSENHTCDSHAREFSKGKKKGKQQLASSAKYAGSKMNVRALHGVNVGERPSLPVTFHRAGLGTGGMGPFPNQRQVLLLESYGHLHVVAVSTLHDYEAKGYWVIGDASEPIHVVDDRRIPYPVLISVRRVWYDNRAAIHKGELQRAAAISRSQLARS
ncbi:hypothetical protein PR048_029052 [Dryococelus australis]|uniref:Uncharacterized protein n=1 Tax=Dryococelus australis TaxID=614101 RepID=A0ABQ9GEU6_9NEOP|nr:hypothetical protein PR048_029052 [Dryococelus australis]